MDKAVQYNRLCLFDQEQFFAAVGVESARIVKEFPKIIIETLLFVDIRISGLSFLNGIFRKIVLFLTSKDGGVGKMKAIDNRRFQATADLVEHWRSTIIKHSLMGAIPR